MKRFMMALLMAWIVYQVHDKCPGYEFMMTFLGGAVTAFMIQE